MTRSPTRSGTVVLDLDGVLYLDKEGIPGAGEALSTLSSAGWDLVYATNNSTKTGDLAARHIYERTGFRADPAAAITSAMAAAAEICDEVATAAYVGAPSIESELEAVGVQVVELDDNPEAVVVGLDRELSYDTVDRASRAIRAGARFIATNTDATYPTPEGPAPGAGMIVAAIATASGVEPLRCGKPYEPFADLIRHRVRPGTVVMVGDRPETDIALGRLLGWTTVLVLSGVTLDASDVPASLTPDHVIPTVADLPRLLGVGEG